MLETPSDWLPVLAKQMDAEARELKRKRDYCNGNAPLPEMGSNLRASWKQFQKKSRIDYGGLAVQALKNRIRPNGVRIGDGSDNPAALAAQRIWRDNRLDAQFSTAILDRLETSVGYLVTGKGSAGSVITAERPEDFLAIPEPSAPWKTRAALKVLRDPVLGRDFAWVWAGGFRQRFVRESRQHGIELVSKYSDTWMLDGEPEIYGGAAPIVALRRPSGRALLEQHFDAIDAINHGKLQRLVVTAMQAFRQRGIKLPAGSTFGESDDDGNEPDYTKMFEPAPGALWELPEGIDVWESEQTDIRPLLEGEKADRRDFAAVTSTPLSVFMPEGQNQSAEGAANAKEGHVSLAQDEIDDIRPNIAMALVHALGIQGVDLADLTVEVDFAPPALVSLSERHEAASKAKATGVLSRRTIQRDILGMTPEQIRQDEADFAAEQLGNMLIAEQVVNATNA